MSRATWRPRLESRTTSAHEAVRSVRSGDRVFVHGSAAAPVELVEALVARAGELEGVRLVHMHTNPAMPRSLGNAFVHVDRLAFAVPIERPPFAAQVPSASEVEQRIGAHVAHLVEDGATLQLGIGAIPNAVLARLGDRRDLGIHTEMFSDGVVDLVERGVVTTRAHVQYVVTEWGVAHLHGKSVRERSEQLTRIAHPAFRDELEAFAWNQRWR